jgi:hypothetical protein
MEKDPAVDLKDEMDRLWDVHELPDDTALLRRIAHNTDVTRQVLLWTLVIVPVIALVLGIIALVQLNALTPSPDTTLYTP